MTYDETRAGNPELSCGLTVGQHLEASPYLLPDPSSSPLRGEKGGGDCVSESPIHAFQG